MEQRTLLEAVDDCVRERFGRREIRHLTARNYRIEWRRMALEVGPELDPRSIDHETMAAWVEAIAAKTKAPSTLHLRVTTAANFWRWMTENGHVEQSPMARIRAPKKPRGVPRCLSGEQVVASFDHVADAREEAILALMVHCGCRAGEVAGVELADVDLASRSLLIREGKGGGQRIVPIGEEAWSVLSRYISERGRHSGRLIQSRTSRHLSDHDGVTPRTISVLASRAIHRADVDETGHALRHTAAKDMLDEGANLRDVQSFLGHSSLQSTQIYVPFSDVKRLGRFAGRKRYRVA